MYLIRHAQPRERGIILGQKDVSIDPMLRGKVINGIHEHLPRNAKVISSPLLRTRETAELFGFEDYKVDERIAEMDLGHYQGLRVSRETLEAINLLADNPDNNYHQGETFSNFYERVSNFFSEYKDDDNVIIFTHSGVIRLLLTKILKLENYQYHPGYLDIIEIHPDKQSYNTIRTAISLV